MAKDEPTTPTPTTPTPTASKSTGKGRGKAAKEPGSGMPQGDVDFLIACLQNTVAGGIQVDLQKVADACGYTNLGSVRNRIGVLKIKYNLAMTASGAKAASAVGTPGSDEGNIASTVFKTPNKPKVTKPKATSTTKKDKNTPTKPRGKKRKVEETEDGDDDLAVKFPGLDNGAEEAEAEAEAEVQGEDDA